MCCAYNHSRDQYVLPASITHPRVIFKTYFQKMGFAYNHIEISRPCLQASHTQGIFKTYLQKMGCAYNHIQDQYVLPASITHPRTIFKTYFQKMGFAYNQIEISRSCLQASHTQSVFKTFCRKCAVHTTTLRLVPTNLVPVTV